jgi:hypothetical protein
MSANWFLLGHDALITILWLFQASLLLVLLSPKSLPKDNRSLFLLVVVRTE